MLKSKSALFIIILLYSCYNKSDYNTNDCIKKDTIKMFYPNGSIKSYDLICNGLKNGLSCYYLESGLLEKSLEYKNDTLNGKGLHFYPDGKIKMEVYFKNGKLEGPYKIYDEKGNIVREIIYKNGIAAE
jgi:antitoxin component YwqK of YwqJK toxin-antitoxin module